MKKKQMLYVSFDIFCELQLCRSILKRMVREKNINVKIDDNKCQVIFYVVNDLNIIFYEYDVKKIRKLKTVVPILLIPKKKFDNGDVDFLKKSNAITDQIIFFDEQFDLYLSPTFKYRKIL